MKRLSRTALPPTACVLALMCASGAFTGHTLRAAPVALPAQVILPTDSSAPGLFARTPVRVDPAHPLRIGEQFYPEESKQLGEQGICVVRVEVTMEGAIRASQLISSSGFERLNVACLSAFEDGRLIPATEGGRPVSTWVFIPVVWRLSGNFFAAIPQVRGDYELEAALKNYPVASRRLHQEGTCIVHVAVGADGIATEVSVTNSSGYVDLDEASLRAVKQAPFVPAHDPSGSPIPAATDIHVSWRLPGSSCAAHCSDLQ